MVGHVIECLNPSLFRYDPLRGCVSVRAIFAEKSYFLIWSSSRIQAVSGLIERPQCRATKQSALPQQLMKFRLPPHPASSMMQGACGSLAAPLISFPDIHGFYHPVSLVYLLLSHSSRSLEGDGQFEWGGEGEGGGEGSMILSLSVSVSL